MSTWRTRFGIQLLQILSLIPVLLLVNVHAATVEEKQPPVSAPGSLEPIPVVYSTVSMGAAS